MAKVIIFEENGKIRLADLIDDEKDIGRDNFTNVIECPEKVLALVPEEIAEFCRNTAPQYLYLNHKGDWKSYGGRKLIR